MDMQTKTNMLTLAWLYKMTDRRTDGHTDRETL